MGIQSTYGAIGKFVQEAESFYQHALLFKKRKELGNETLQPSRLNEGDIDAEEAEILALGRGMEKTFRQSFEDAVIARPKDALTQ